MVTGIIAGCLGMILLALGIVMIKDVLEQSNVFWATLVRLGSAAATLCILMFFYPGRSVAQGTCDPAAGTCHLPCRGRGLADHYQLT